MAAKRSRGLYCGVALCALLVPGVAVASDFTIVSGPPVTTTQILDTPGDVGTVELGGIINVPADDGIEATADGVTVNNAGSVTGGGGTPNAAIKVLSNSTVGNSGTATGNSFGIFAWGDINSISNSGTVTGYRYGIHAIGENNSISNSGTVKSDILFGIYALGENNSISNSGTATGGTMGIVTNGDTNSISNSGTATGSSYGINAGGDSSSILNSGTATGGIYGISASGDANSISNSGTATGATYGIYALGDSNSISNSGTTTSGSYGIYALGDSNTITNSGTAIGATASVRLNGTNNTLNLLAGSKLRGILRLGTGNFLNIGPGLNTAFAYADELNLNTFGAPYVDNGGILAVIDPTGFSTQDEQLTDLTRAITNTVDGRLASARIEGTPLGVAMNGMTIVPTADVPAGPNAVMWAAGLGNYRNQSGDGADAAFDSMLGGFTLGLDGEVADGMRTGGFIGAALSQLENDGGSTIDTDSYFGGLYASFAGSGHFLNLSLTGGYADQSSDRKVANNQVVGGIEHAEADYSGFFVSPSATLGTDIHMNTGILTPSVRARYAGMFLDGYTETGSSTNLSVDSHNVNVIDLRGQLVFAPTPTTMDGGTFSTNFRLGADGTFANGDKVDAVLLGQSLSFNVSNDETTVRGFAGLDMAYVSDGGSRFFLGAEAGYDTSDAVTGEAKAGFEIPL